MDWWMHPVSIGYRNDRWWTHRWIDRCVSSSSKAVLMIRPSCLNWTCCKTLTKILFWLNEFKSNSPKFQQQTAKERSVTKFSFLNLSRFESRLPWTELSCMSKCPWARYWTPKTAPDLVISTALWWGCTHPERELSPVTLRLSHITQQIFDCLSYRLKTSFPAASNPFVQGGRGHSLFHWWHKRPLKYWLMIHWLAGTHTHTHTHTDTHTHTHTHCWTAHTQPLFIPPCSHHPPLFLCCPEPANQRTAWWFGSPPSCMCVCVCVWGGGED